MMDGFRVVKICCTRLYTRYVFNVEDIRRLNRPINIGSKSGQIDSNVVVRSIFTTIWVYYEAWFNGSIQSNVQTADIFG